VPGNNGAADGGVQARRPLFTAFPKKISGDSERGGRNIAALEKLGYRCLIARQRELKDVE
jgi:G:T-mismatch repair DNA endonuclease (very short patch repair protein)